MVTLDFHGGNIYRLKREGKEELLDYSSNINPLGIPKSFRDTLTADLSHLVRYPDPEYVELREAIGDYNGIPFKNIVVGNGATEILFLHMRTLKPKTTVIISPTFGEYERALTTVDSNLVFYPLKEENDFRFDLEEFKENCPPCDLVVLCNPNNPTGGFVSLDTINELNEFLKTKGTKLFIDEAFIEFIEGWMDLSAANLKDENIFIMRALTKYFALPGIRLGYGISFDLDLLEKMNREKEPWSVNSFAESAGKIILRDNEYIHATDRWISEEKEFFYHELSKIPDIKVYRPNCNFILVKLLKDNSKDFREKMIEKGVIVRDASNFRTLDGSFIRLAIKDRENNLKVISTIGQLR